MLLIIFSTNPTNSKWKMKILTTFSFFYFICNDLLFKISSIYKFYQKKKKKKEKFIKCMRTPIDNFKVKKVSKKCQKIILWL